MSAAATPGGLLPTRALFRESWKWLRNNWVRTLVFSVLSFLIAWTWNVWIMARKLEGSVADPGSETTATAQGKTWNGIYWLLCTTILFGLITYGREKGFKNLLREFFTPPFTFIDNLVRRPRAAIAMGAWGAALALLVGSVISNAISGMLGLGFLLAAPTALAIVLNNVLIRAWVGAFSAAQPRRRHDAMGLANPYAMMLGEAVGAIVAWRVDGATVPVVLAVVLVAVSFLVVAGGSDRPLPNPVPIVLLLGAGIVGWKILRASVALADDGGWSECVTASGEPCSQLNFFKGWWEWRKSAGADVVIRQGRVGGTFSALGCLAGCMLGGGLAAVAAAFSSSATGGLGVGASPATPGQPPPQAPHGVAQPLQPGDSFAPPSATPASTPDAMSSPEAPLSADAAAATGAPSIPPPGAPSSAPSSAPSPPAPSPVARSGAVPPGELPPPPGGAPHGIAHGMEGVEPHPTAPADVTPTSAARHAPDMTPEPTGSGDAPHGIAHGMEGVEPHPTAPADVSPTSAARHAPDVTPEPTGSGDAPHGIAHGMEGVEPRATLPGGVSPTSAARHAPDVTPSTDPADVSPTSAARHAPDVTPPTDPADISPTSAARHAPDVTPPTDPADISPTSATRHAPDVAPSQAGVPADAPPPGGQPPAHHPRAMLDDVLPDEDKVEDEEPGDGESDDTSGA